MEEPCRNRHRYEAIRRARVQKFSVFVIFAYYRHIYVYRHTHTHTYVYIRGKTSAYAIRHKCTIYVKNARACVRNGIASVSIIFTILANFYRGMYDR